MSRSMTPRQKEVLDFINVHIARTGGVAPSYQEIAEGVGLTSKSGVHRHVHGLIERGKIQNVSAGWYGKARSLAPVENEALARMIARVARQAAKTGRAPSPSRIRTMLAGVA